MQRVYRPVIWSTTLSDGSKLIIDKGFYAYREGNRGRYYTIHAQITKETNRGVCQIRPDGTVYRWYKSHWMQTPGRRVEILRAIRGISKILLVEQVLES